MDVTNLDEFESHQHGVDEHRRAGTDLIDKAPLIVLSNSCSLRYSSEFNRRLINEVLQNIKARLVIRLLRPGRPERKRCWQ